MLKVNEEKLKAVRFDDGRFMSNMFPGGYALVYYDDNGEETCPNCANKAQNSNNPEYNFSIADYDVNWENDFLFCTNCNTKLEPEYEINNY